MNIRSTHISRTYRWRKLQQEFKAKCKALNLPCWLCRQPINYAAKANTRNAFEADHALSVATHPWLAYDPGNIQPSHHECNRKRHADSTSHVEWIQPSW